MPGEGHREEDVEFELAAFSLTAIKKAMYRLSGRADLALDLLSGERERARIRVRPLRGEDARGLAAELRREVIDCDLRELIGRETEAVRSVILAQAFSKTAILDPRGDDASFAGDPLGIAEPDV